MSNYVVVPFTAQSKKLSHLKVNWTPGSNTITLVSNDDRIIAQKKHHTYTTSEGAQEGAEKWFKLIERMFNGGEDA